MSRLCDGWFPPSILDSSRVAIWLIFIWAGKIDPSSPPLSTERSCDKGCGRKWVASVLAETCFFFTKMFSNLFANLGKVLGSLQLLFLQVGHLLLSFQFLKGDLFHKVLIFLYTGRFCLWLMYKVLLPADLSSMESIRQGLQVCCIYFIVRTPLNAMRAL